jgi:hypothetical protein
MLNNLIYRLRNLTPLKRGVVFVLIFLTILSVGIYLGVRSDQTSIIPGINEQEPVRSEVQTGEEYDPNYRAFGEIPSGRKIIISDVEVNNFFLEKDQLESEAFIPINRGAGYSIAYYNNFNQFLISITDAPFEEIRHDAEQKFIDGLDISEEDACKLDVIITTPRFANPDLAGQIFRLSFCD